MKKQLFFLLLLFSKVAAGQNLEIFTPNNSQAIQIDRRTKKTDNPIPFERGFPLQYALDKEDIFNVFIYKVNIKGGVRHLDLSTDAQGNVISKYHLKSYDTLKNILTINVNGLPPKTLIDIAILRRLNKLELDSVLYFNELLYNNYTANNPVTDAGIGKLYEDFVTFNLKPKEYKEPAFDKLNYADFKTLFGTLYNFYQNIKTYNYTLGIGNIDDIEIADFDEKLRAAKIDDTDLLPISKIVTSGLLSDFMNGNVDITGSYPAGNISKPEKYDLRIAHLDAALIAIDKTLSLTDKLLMTGADQDTKDLRAELIEWRKYATNNRKNIFDNYTNILKGIKNNGYLSREEWLITGNDFNDFTQLSKFVVIPDIGITTMALRGHDAWHFFPRPFAGVNIYFRPVDKSLPEKNFPDFNLLRVMSLQLGLTYGDLGNKEYSNLFNDFSLMAGPSFKLNRWFRLGAGTILTKQTNANPLISDLHTNFGGYFSFSFDLDIFSNAGSVKTRVFK